MLKRLKFVVEQWLLFMVRRQTWQAGAALRNFRIGPSLSIQIESGRPIRIRIESGSFACPNRKATYAACKPLFFSSHWDIGDVKARNCPKFEFFSNSFPILWNPFAKVDGSMPECAQVRALYMRLQSTALGDAKENRNGRRLSPYRRKPQNWYYVTHFLAHPVEPRDRWVQTHATVG